MTEIRVRFERREQIKYIAHLDILKVFERALRRSSLPVSHTKGYNPHPEIVFGLPLPLGLISLAEYADIKLDDAISPKELLVRLGTQLPEGLNVVAAGIKRSKGNIMAVIDLAEYVIGVCASAEMGTMDMQAVLQKMMRIDELPVEKKTKSGRSVVDIKPMVKSLEISYDCGCAVRARLSAGSRANLKPETLFEAMRIYGGFQGVSNNLCRTGLFIKKDGEYVDPLDDRVL